MPDYASLKVPELKKLLQEASLPISGNKADLIARLQQNDEKMAGNNTAPATGEDEIDWDEDDNKAATTSTAAAVTVGGQEANPVTVPSQAGDPEPSNAADSKVGSGEGASTALDGVAVATATTTAEQAAPEVPKQDFSIGIRKTDAEKEAERRAARAKRFGISEDDETKKLADRAKKFGLDTNASIVKGLDDALPERRAKRGREEKKDNERAAKRQTPDRRTEPAKHAAKGGAKAAPAKKPTKGVLDDPVEKAKAEARAKRFQTAA